MGRFGNCEDLAARCIKSFLLVLGQGRAPCRVAGSDIPTTTALREMEAHRAHEYACGGTVAWLINRTHVRAWQANAADHDEGGIIVGPRVWAFSTAFGWRWGWRARDLNRRRPAQEEGVR